MTRKRYKKLLMGECGFSRNMAERISRDFMRPKKYLRLPLVEAVESTTFIPKSPPGSPEFFEELTAAGYEYAIIE